MRLSGLGEAEMDENNVRPREPDETVVDENHMLLIEQLEYPLPILRVSALGIAVETAAAGATGSFFLENAGGGILSGLIMSNNPCLRFQDERFEGNKCRVVYSVAPDGLRPGDMIQTSAVIMSNGGERIIPIDIKVIPPAIETEAGVNIASLRDMCEYTQRRPSLAQSLFASDEFAQWLENTGFEQMDIYEFLRKDPNNQRALDNFLVFCGFKEKAYVTCGQGPARIDVVPGSSETIGGKISVEGCGWGFLDEPIRTRGGAKWLELSPKRLTSADFDADGMALVYYNVNAALVDACGGEEHILIGSRTDIALAVKKKKPLHISLSKECYAFGETGALICTNNTGSDALIEVETRDGFIRDGFVRFEDRQYIVGNWARIPFAIKSGALTSAQMTIKKQPTLTGAIALKITVGGAHVYTETLTVTAGVSFK